MGRTLPRARLGQWLFERLGQAFAVENRPGADGNLATEAVVRSPADGHTLLLVISANTINATLYDKVSFALLLHRVMSGSNQRPDTLMQDRTSANSMKADMAPK